MQVNPHNPIGVSAQQMLNAGAPVERPENAAKDTASFAQVVGQAVEEARALAEQKSQEMRGAAEQLVATTFIMPLFSQLRSESMVSDLFHGGRGEAIFQQQLDQVLSDRISTGAGFDLVDTVASYFAGRPADEAGGVDLMDAARARVRYEPVVSEGVDLHG